MFRIAITGGMGMGKSTAARVLAEMGLSVIEADELAREVVEPGQPAHAEIMRQFGSRFFDARGRLRRDAMAELIFTDPDARRRLEAIVHPAVWQAWQTRLAELRQRECTLVVAVVPLLFEVGWSKEFDSVWCVACARQTQITRLTRRGLTMAQIEARLHAQWPIERKMELADHVIWTEGCLELYKAQLERILAGLSVAAGQKGVGPAS